MKQGLIKKKTRGRNTRCGWILILAVVLSGLFGCSKSEEFVVSSNEYAAAAEADGAEEVLHSQTGEATDSEQANFLYVDVCGAVKYPGVYCLNSDARVFEALEMAGGMTAEGCALAVNKAEFLSDGQQLYIPTWEEYEADTAKTGQDLSQDDGRVNINTADVRQLCTLPGIGETRALAIIEYRESHGKFESAESIQQVSGIKSGTYEKIKNYIKVQ